jgi:hypothetical protein
MTADLAYARPPDLAVVETEDEDGVPTVYLCALPSGPLVVLNGPGALIWQEAQVGDGPGLAERVAGRVAAEADDVRVEVDRFLDVLTAQGLLVTADG